MTYVNWQLAAPATFGACFQRARQRALSCQGLRADGGASPRSARRERGRCRMVATTLVRRGASPPPSTRPGRHGDRGRRSAPVDNFPENTLHLGL